MIKRQIALLTVGVALALLFAAAGHAANEPQAKKKLFNVNCDEGGSVAKALEFARPHAKIYVKGTCHERIRIVRDGIRLIGHDGATFDGSSFGSQFAEFEPLIRIKDARMVVLENLSVRYSPGEGVLIEGQASVQLEQLNVHDNANVGLLVDHARVEVTQSSFNDNLSGIDSTNNASLVLRGQVSLTGNTAFGIAASNAASLEVRGAVVDASQNGGFGAIIEGGQLAIFNFGVSQGSQVLANQNGACGIAVVAGGLIDVIAPPPLYFSGVNLISAQQNGCGLVMISGSKLESPFGAATFDLSGNGVGMQILSNSDVFINGGLNVSGNAGPGLVADGAGTLTLGPADGSTPPPLGSSIDSNGGPDAVMSFGSRATFAANVNVGSLVCDGTALVRGSTACP